MKKYLFIALAALGFAACAEKLDDNSPVHNGELEESYIAINLLSADVDTRAATDSYGYEEGTTAERAVKSAYFFFFDENGEPFNVTGYPVTTPGEVQNGKNHLILSISNASTSGMPNVSDIKDAILVLKTYKGVYPSKIVAVLNWIPDEKPYSLTALHGALEAIGDDSKGYVMSNSVYMDGADKMIDAVPLTAANTHHSVSRFSHEEKGAPPSQASPFNGKISHQKVKINVMSILSVAAGGFGPPASPFPNVISLPAGRALPTELCD